MLSKILFLEFTVSIKNTGNCVQWFMYMEIKYMTSKLRIIYDNGWPLAQTQILDYVVDGSLQPAGPSYLSIWKLVTGASLDSSVG